MRTETTRRLRDRPEAPSPRPWPGSTSWSPAGEDVVNLCRGNHDLPTPPHIVEALRREVLVLDPATHRYGSFSGLLELKAAIGDWYAAHHRARLDPETEVRYVTHPFHRRSAELWRGIAAGSSSTSRPDARVDVGSPTAPPGLSRRGCGSGGVTSGSAR